MSSDLPVAAVATGEPPPPVKLHAFGVEEVPADLIADVRRLLGLSATAQARFWEVLGPSLASVVAPEVDRLLRRFAEAHHVDGMALAHAVKGCRNLIRQASAVGLDSRLFAEDLARIGGGGAALGDLLAPGYEHVNGPLRSDIHRSAVADQGKLLESVRFRVDLLSAVNQGVKLRFPAVTLTLHYREGSRREQVTLQVLPEVLKQLHGMCEQILGRR